MKLTFKLFLILFSVTFFQKNFAQNTITFDESSYEKIIKRSKTEKKPIFLMIYATWCPHCNKMKKEVFTDKKVIDFLNSNFVLAQQDGDSLQGKYLKEKFKVKSLPTFIFLDENETELYKLSGEYTPEALISESKNALNPQMQLPFLEKQFNDDFKNPDKCMAYLVALRKGNDRKILSVPAHKYLATLSEKELVTNQNWMIISNGVTDIKSREFQYVLSHKKDFEAVVGENRVKRKVVNIVTELLKPLVDNLDTINYYKQRPIAASIALPETDELIFNYDLTINELSENWKKYSEATLKSVEKFAWNDASLLKQIAQNYEKHNTDKNSLKEAIKWVQRSLELNESYDGLLLISKLYNKTSDKKQAIFYANKAKNFAKNLGFATDESDALLKQLK